ncbi:uncharacterized protein LOC6638587 [Drosophila willistoni]|uniref:uncharacterized protein LOC6638587 n=1 Tax=Drosophila willistoni TaxID=7260 RepID=UPI000C26D68D|nr:uncharacterized protein LOC6638587 [Drosophila willistoni]
MRYRRRLTMKSVSSHSLDPGNQVETQEEEEDPCKRGILRNTCCRRYRERLRSSRQTNIFQGLMTIVGISLAISLLILNGIEVSETASEMGLKATAALASASAAMEMNQAKDALWMGITKLFANIGESMPHQQVGDEEEAKGEPSKTTHSYHYHCKEKRLDTKQIFHQIGKKVLNQEQALTRLERALDSDCKLNSIALLGPSGVGKTLTAMTLRQHFPWPENVHAYSWSTYVPDEVRKFHMIRQFVENLSDCGKNLLIIDNLSACDYSIVPIYNQMTATTVANQSVFIVYIFNLENEHYWQQIDILQNLPDDTTLVNFRPFGRNELKDCLENELEMRQQYFGQKTLRRIINKIYDDFYSKGCKGLRELILKNGLSGIV